jgi:hypothetical protein
MPPKGGNKQSGGKANSASRSGVERRVVPSGSDSQRRAASAASLSQTVKGAKPGPKGSGANPKGETKVQRPRGLSPQAGTADATKRRQAAEKGKLTPQGDMTPKEWEAANPGATDDQKRAYRNEYSRIGGVLQSRGYAPLDTAQTNHIADQARVGGTKGSGEVVDRSSAVKKSWETRKKLYGESGRKES